MPGEITRRGEKNADTAVKSIIGYYLGCWNVVHPIHHCSIANMLLFIWVDDKEQA